MRYVVAINGRRIGVEVGADGVRVEGEPVHARLDTVSGTPVRLITLGNTVHRVVVRRRADRGTYTLWIDGFAYEAEALDERTRAVRDLTRASAPPGISPIVAPMPGLIVRVQVAAGDDVQAGQSVVVMEAMKMENELRAVAPARVKRVLVSSGQVVEKGAVLVDLEPRGERPRDAGTSDSP